VHLIAADVFGCLSCEHFLELDLMTSVRSANRPHNEGAPVDGDGAAGLEIDHIGLVDVEAEKAVEPMGPAQPANHVGSISR
jgi:hypothetical protein